MAKPLQIVVSEIRVGAEPTPKQSAQRQKFTEAVQEVAEEMKGTRLRGAARVRAFNTKVSQRLKG